MENRQMDLIEKIKSRRFVQSSTIILLATLLTYIDKLSGWEWVLAVSVSVGIYTTSDILKKGG